MRKKLFLLALGFLTSGTLLAQSGACGDNVDWTINGETLIISGEGPMQEFMENGKILNPTWFPFIDGIKHVVIEPGVTTIGAGTFYNNEQLETVSIPEGIIKIGAKAFSGCSGLTQIKLPESLEELTPHYVKGSTWQGSHFSKCTGLTTFTIPKNVKLIGPYAFADCTNLKHIVYQCENAELRTGHTLYYDPYIFRWAGIDSVEISSSVKVVPSRLFIEVSLSYLKTNGSVEIVGDKAFDLSNPIFMNRTGAIMIDKALYAYIPENAKAFSLNIPEGTTSISPNAIRPNQQYLYELTVPSTLYDFGLDALKGCTSLSNLNWNAKKCNFNGSNAPFADKTLYSVTFGEDVEEINANMLSKCSSLKKLILPPNLKKIESGAFYECSELTELIIPESVTAIGKSAFSQCKKLKTLVIPDGVISLGDQSGLTGLQELTIGLSVKEMGTFDIYNVETIYWNSRNCDNDRYNSSIFYYYGNDAFKNMIIGPEVESIPSYFCKKCTSLENIDFSACSKLKSIRNYAFEDCTALKNIYLPDGLVDVGYSSIFGTPENIFLPASLEYWGGRCTCSGTVICAFNQLAENVATWSLGGNAIYYVADTNLYKKWGNIYERGDIKPLVMIADDATTVFQTIDGVVQFDSTGLTCNIPGYEVDFDFEANGTAPGTYDMVKANFKGANQFSAMIPFTYTITADLSSISSLTDGSTTEKCYYDMTGRPIAHPSNGFYIERRSDGTTRKIFIQNRH